MIKTIRIRTFLATSAITVLTLASTARSQIPTPFPTGIDLFHAPNYPGNITNYSSALSSYYWALTGDVPSDISAGLNGWTSAPLNLTSALGSNPWIATGGTVKAIYLGETAGWKDDFGYVNSAAPNTYVPLATRIAGQSNLFSGQETYVSYAAGTTLDFFLNSGGSLNQGGLFFAFGTANAFAGNDTSSHIKWKIVDLPTTYLDVSNNLVTTPVPTLLVGWEDTRKGVFFYDGDFNDLVMAFQFPPAQGDPVPEPATYGIAGILALGGIIGWRRFKKHNNINLQAA